MTSLDDEVVRRVNEGSREPDEPEQFSLHDEPGWHHDQRGGLSSQAEKSSFESDFGSDISHVWPPSP